MSQEQEEDDVSESEMVDSFARKELHQLKERFEGGTLVPSFSLIFRKALHTITTWSGWETLGIGCGFSTILLFLVAIFVFLGRACTSHEQTLIERHAISIRNQYQPACESLGLEFVSVQNVQVISNSGDNVCTGDFCPGIVESVVCAGNNRVVTINARDISQSTVQILEQ